MSVEKNMIHTLIEDDISFTVLVNDSINKISDCAALGIYAYLASKPPGWVVRNSELEKHFDKGKDFIKQKLAYLREIGALQTSKIRDEAGKIVRHETIVKKMFSSIGVKIQPLENHTRGNPADGESAPIKERYIEKKDNINTLSLTLSHPEKKEIEREREKLKPIEYQESLYDSQSLSEHIEQKQQSDKLFEQFWALYPIKKAEKRARAAWYSQKCYLNSHAILSKLEQQVKFDRHFKDGYAPNPDKYILEERWLDEVHEKKKTGADASVITDWDKDLHLDII